LSRTRLSDVLHDKAGAECQPPAAGGIFGQPMAPEQVYTRKWAFTDSSGGHTMTRDTMDGSPQKHYS
jgi:hypothetical protein